MRYFVAVSITALALAGCNKKDANDPFAGRASSSDEATKGEFKPSPPGKYEWTAPPQNGSASADHVHDVRPEEKRTYHQ